MEAQQPLIIYHRGRHGKDVSIEENTLQAFERAITEHAAMIEFDVWDGLSIAHEPDHAGKVPTLTEAMEAINARCAVNIEIKSPRAIYAVASVVALALRSGGWKEHQIVLSSFHHGSAIAMKRLFPRLVVGVINDGVLEPVYIDWLAKQGIDNLHVEWTNVYMDIENGHRMRAVLRANKMHLWVWTVNTKEIFEKVALYGAEAIFTDQPQLFR